MVAGTFSWCRAARATSCGPGTVSEFDVYSFGVIASSTLYQLNGSFPAAEGYAEIGAVHHMTGGEATNSSICLAALGVRVRLDGSWIGANESGRRLKARLGSLGVDTSRLLLKEGYAGVSEVVFAANATRTIFGTYGRMLEDIAWNMPGEEDIRRARCVSLDPFFGEASIRAAEKAAEAGVPVVTVDCRHDSPIVEYASAVIIAESWLGEQYPGQSPGAVFEAYRQACPGLVVFTFGDKPLLFAAPDEDVQTYQPHSVDAVDTTGAGDSFRAGIVYGFLECWEIPRTIEFASALAGLVCTRSPGVQDAPSLDEVHAFSAERASGTGVG